MVHFTHPTLDSSDRLAVSAGFEPDGYRLVVDFPDGRQLIHRFFSQPELYRGTVKLQANLLGDGWQPASAPVPRPGTSHATRSRHFPRSTRLG